DQQANAGAGSNAAAFGPGAGLGTAAWATDSAMHAPDLHDSPPSPTGNPDDWDEDAVYAMPAPSSPAGPQKYVEEDALQPPPARQGQDDAAAAAGIITFPVPARARNTKKLPLAETDVPDDGPGAAAVAA